MTGYVQVLTVQLLAGATAFFDQVLILVEAAEDMYRNNINFQNVLNSKESEELLSMALKADLVIGPTTPLV